ncbi:MoxR family ATPase [Lachnospiraceae bacterium ASD3451]|uniref:AAA family ATPase n=1 Tax=Diplocloster agilis TaxID=2850323 RepID=UPI001D8FEB6D|nr:MoxR family ATPase [Diplocloster agilis]MBU9744594.1 MoxR family ATPase [Diplocloster agilis]
MPITSSTAVQIMDEVKKAVIGKDDCIRKVLSAILAGGHILIEDIPGVGKTTMAVAFSRSMGMLQHRVQFTPDVLPADITGFTMFQKETGLFEYQPGAIMCNLFLADEINRASPKTQSALLEVMEEGKVTVDRVTHPVPDPFVVIATENPFGSAGTQMLPESQLDRFFICITMGYPDIKDEIEIVKGTFDKKAYEKIQPVISPDMLIQMQGEVQAVFVHDVLYDYIGRLVTATRNHPLIQTGLSPRGTIALAKMAKATAYLAGRDFCIPADAAFVFPDVACHRIHLNAKARAGHIRTEDIIREILKNTPSPTPKKTGRKEAAKKEVSE